MRDSKVNTAGSTNGNADTDVDDTINVVVTITNIDESGTVTLPATITAGQPVTATLTDHDGTVSNVIVAVVDIRHGRRDVHTHQRGHLQFLHARGRGRRQVPEGHGVLLYGPPRFGEVRNQRRVQPGGGGQQAPVIPVH